MTDIILNGTALSDAVPDALVTRVTRQLVGDRRDILEQLPGRAGSWRFSEQPGDRIISIEVNIQSPRGDVGTAQDARRAAVVALADWVDQRDAQLIIDDEDDRYWVATLDGAPLPDEWIDSADIIFDFRVGPYALALEPSVLPLELLDVAPATFTIDDTVNAYPVIEITAGSDMDDGFILTVNGLVLTYGTAIAAGDIVTVSSLSFTVATGANSDTDLAGAFVVGDLSMADVDGDFPILVPGENSITVTGADSDVTITWRRRYR